MPLLRNNTVSEESKLLRGIFAHQSSLGAAIRSPLEYLPTYATFFGDDKGPATLVLSIIWILLFVIPFTHRGPQPIRKTVMRINQCVAALTVLAVHIDLPMADALASTFRCYAVILALICQIFLSGPRGGSDVKVGLSHLMAVLQLLFLPGVWSRVQEMVDANAEGIALIFMTPGILWVFPGSIVLLLCRDDDPGQEEEGRPADTVRTKETVAREDTGKRKPAKEENGDSETREGKMTAATANEDESLQKVEAKNTDAKGKAKEEEGTASRGSMSYQSSIEDDSLDLKSIAVESQSSSGSIEDTDAQRASLEVEQDSGSEQFVCISRTHSSEEVRIDMERAEPKNESLTALDRKIEQISNEGFEHAREESPQDGQREEVTNVHEQASESSRELEENIKDKGEQNKDQVAHGEKQHVFARDLPFRTIVYCFLDALLLTLTQFL